MEPLGNVTFLSQDKKIQKWTSALQINIPLLVTMNRKIKKPPVKLNFWQST